MRNKLKKNEEKTLFTNKKKTIFIDWNGVSNIFNAISNRDHIIQFHDHD